MIVDDIRIEYVGPEIDFPYLPGGNNLGSMTIAP